MLRAYLDELRRELSRTLPGEDVQARLTEAEAHLQEGIEGRMELGLDEPTAVHEAIAAFGAARRVAGSLARRPSLMSRLAIIGVGYASAVLLFAALFPVVWELRRGIEAVFVFWIFLGIAFAVIAFRARRPAPLPIFGAGLLGTAAVWLVAGSLWIDLTPYGGRGVVPPGGAASTRADAARRLAERSSDLQALDAGLNTLAGPLGIEGLRSGPGYRAPTDKDYAAWDARLTFTTIEDPQAAQWAWLNVRAHNHWTTDVEDSRAMLTALDKARSGSTVRNMMTMVPSVVPANVGVAAFAVVLDLAAGGLGILAFALRKDRRRGVA